MCGSVCGSRTLSLLENISPDNIPLDNLSSPVTKTLDNITLEYTSSLNCWVYTNLWYLLYDKWYLAWVSWQESLGCTTPKCWACLDGAGVGVEVGVLGWRSGGPRFQSHPRLTSQSWSRYQLNQVGSEAASESTFDQKLWSTVEYLRGIKQDFTFEVQRIWLLLIF